MAGLVIPVIEFGAGQAARWLAGGAAAAGAGAIAGKVARDREQEAAQSKHSTLANTDATAKSKEKCKECPPDKGVPFTRVFRERKPWVDYQARVTGMASGPTFIMEWLFGGVQFDGFVSAQCLLQEAKAGYDQFFNQWGEFKYDFQERIFEDMMLDAIRQNNVAIPKPPVQLRWYFQEPVSFRHMEKILRGATPQIEVVFEP